MNTERTEKFVNAIACDLEEGGFRQVSGTTLRRTLATAVSAALPLLGDIGIPASQPAELAEQQGVDPSIARAISSKDLYQVLMDVQNGIDSPALASMANGAIQMIDKARNALAATGKQQVGEAMDREQLGDLVEGMAVSVDVDGLFSTEGRRLFGTITAVQHEDGEKGGLMLLVQEPEPNWKPEQVGEVQGDALVASLVQIMNAEYDGLGRLPADVLGVLNMAAEALASRQPGAQEPTHWQHCEVPHLCITDATKRELKEGETGRGIRKIDNAYSIPAYAAPTAQGIDLGQLRKLAMPILCGMLCASDAERACRRLHAALIDQRDAAPGVGNG